MFNGKPIYPSSEFVEAVGLIRPFFISIILYFKYNDG